MTFEENLQRKENGIIFAPNYGNFELNIRCADKNLALWDGKHPQYMDYVTNRGIEID